MCGIAGLVRTDGTRGHLDEMNRTAASMASALVHRGPDDAGVWSSPDGQASLGHRRLSIVDLSPLGRNPMLWDDGRLAITFNGEIYNFQELRRELESHGHRFRSHTDTEVILAAYDQWGLDCVSRFAGMFAIALWDSPRRRLWLVRDRLGKKPLYYTEQGGSLRFASEIKALLQDPGVPRDVDTDALRLYLRYGYVPAPYAIFRGVHKLPPGHYLLHDASGTRVTRYWDPLDHIRPSNRDEATLEAEFESVLSTAVRQRLIADVPLGAFLSGGIDSSLVVALMQEQSATPVKTFSIRFDNPEFNEADHAAAVAKHLGTDHYEQTCGEREMRDIIDRVPDMFDEPFADSSAIPTYLVSKIARSRVTVSLSGDGGDELFLGYPRYQYQAFSAALFRLPYPARLAVAAVAKRMPVRRVRRAGDVLRERDGDTYNRFVTWTPQAIVSAMSGSPAPQAPFYGDALARLGHVHPRFRAGLLDVVSYLPDDILAKVDRASMAVSLEVRAPLLDHRVVECALRLPLHMKHRRGSTKWILRQLLYKRVPKALLDRPKMGFGAPLDDWFRGPLRDRMHEYATGHDFEDLGLDAAPIRALWADCCARRPYRTDLLWQAYVLAAWSRRFLAMRTAA